MAECDFCRIASGAGEAYVVYEDEQTVAFLDADPAIRGHTLVAPRAHEEFLFTVDETGSGPVFRTVQRVALAVHDALEADGVSVFYTSAGLVGNVTHAHVHVLPRYVDDDIHLALDRGSLDDDQAARLAARIRTAV